MALKAGNYGGVGSLRTRQIVTNVGFFLLGVGVTLGWLRWRKHGTPVALLNTGNPELGLTGLRGLPQSRYRYN